MNHKCDGADLDSLHV